MMSRSPRDTQLVQSTYLAFMAIVAGWIAAWIVKVRILDPALPWFTSPAGAFAFWMTAKLTLWVGPALWLIRVSGRSLREVVNGSRWKHALLWGGSAGFAIALTALVPKYLDDRPLIHFTWSMPMINVLLQAPILEEFLLRGAVFGNLCRHHSLALANVASSLLFVALHLPGWYFMDTLAHNSSKPLGGALSIFLLGLVFGYVTHRARSFLAGSVEHLINNLFA